MDTETKIPTSNRREMFQISVDTQILYDLLAKVEPGGFIDYEMLSHSIGRDVRLSGHGNLATARKRLMQDNRVVFGVVRKEGLKRLDDSGIVATGDFSMGRIHRETTRAVKRISCVQSFEHLSEAEKVKQNTTRSLCGAIHEVTKPRNVKRLEGKVMEARETLSFIKTIEFFAGNGKS